MFYGGRGIVPIVISGGGGGSSPQNVQLINQAGVSNSSTSTQGFTWEPPGIGIPSSYNVYRNGSFIANVTTPISITGSISGTTLTVTAITNGPILCGMKLTGAATNTLIRNQLTGANGSTGTYRVMNDLNTTQTNTGPYTCWKYMDTTATNSNVLTYDAPSTEYYYQVSAIVSGNETALSTDYVCYEYQYGVPHCINGGFAAAFGSGGDDSADTSMGVIEWRMPYSVGGGFIQPYSENPMAPTYDLEVLAFRYLMYDMYLQGPATLQVELHSRVPLPVGDVFSDHALLLASYIVGGGPQLVNTWQTYKFPFIGLGVGTTEYLGYISGSASVTINGVTQTASTMTVTAITNGTVGVTIPGIDRGAQLIGLSGTTVTHGTYVWGMDGENGTSGTGGTGTYVVWPAQTVGSSGTPLPMSAIRSNFYKHNTNNISGPAVVAFTNNIRFSRL